MIALITYLDFHADNYQGGSGKTFVFTHALHIPSEMKSCQIWEFAINSIKERVIHQKPFNKALGEKLTIQKIELMQGYKI